MKYKSLLITLSVLAAGILCGAEKPPLRVYMAPRIADTVDAAGMTSPAVWKGIPESSDFGLFAFGRKELPQEKTSFRAAYNQSGIFLQILCGEKLTSRLDFSRQPIARDNSSAVFSKPVAEVFLDPGFSRKIAAQIVVNINGGVYDRLGDVVTWDYPLKTEIIPDAGKKGYVFYLMLPWKETSYDNPEVYQFSMTPAANPVIGFNVGREQAIGGGELSQWNPTLIQFMRPDHFGALVLSDEPGAKTKMLALFTDEVIAGGIDIQGANQSAETILRELLRNKLENGEKLIASLPKPEKAHYGKIYAAIRQQFRNAKTQKELKRLLTECVQTSNKLEKAAFDTMKQQIFDEI